MNCPKCGKAMLSERPHVHAAPPPPPADPSAEPQHPGYGWHANGDLCGGEQCHVLDEHGNHPEVPADPSVRTAPATTAGQALLDDLADYEGAVYKGGSVIGSELLRRVRHDSQRLDLRAIADGILAIEAEAAQPAPELDVETRTVIRNDYGMVVVGSLPEEPEPTAVEFPAWAVRAIYAQAGKDPVEEGRKLSAFINAHTTGLEVERLAQAWYGWLELHNPTGHPWESLEQWQRDETIENTGEFLAEYARLRGGER